MTELYPGYETEERGENVEAGVFRFKDILDCIKEDLEDSNVKFLKRDVADLNREVERYENWMAKKGTASK